MRKVKLDRKLLEDLAMIAGLTLALATLATLAYVLGLGDGWADWRVMLVLVVGSWLMAAGVYVQNAVHRARARRRLMAGAREQMERVIDAQNCGHAGCGDSGSSATLHECWSKRGRSWSYMTATGWVEGVRGTCAEVHDPAEATRRMQGRAE